MLCVNDGLATAQTQSRRACVRGPVADVNHFFIPASKYIFRILPPGTMLTQQVRWRSPFALYDKCSSSLLLSVVERDSLDPYTRDKTQGSSISGVISSMQHNFPSTGDCLFHAICVIGGCTFSFIVGPFNYLIGT